MVKSETTLIHFETLGCKVNQIETESVARSFYDAGFKCTMGGITSASEVDTRTLVSVLNTCTVTAKAEQKARRLIRLLLEKYPMACVIVTGCYAELEKALLENIDSRICVLKGTQKDLLAELPSELVRFFDSAHTTKELPTSLTQFCDQFFNKRIENSSPINESRTFTLSTDTFMQHSRPSIKIQDGCNSRCTYCRICLARGKSISLAPQEILERIKLLESAKQCEVTITGINISQYKHEGMDFSNLLAFLLDNTKNIYFRISSLHPQIVTEELCKVLAHERVRPHFHVSIQSASDHILQKMARPYNSQTITTAIYRLRKAKKNPFIACDIIVGFPGETEEDFLATKLLCENEKLTWVHAFPFSPRPDTVAFSMKPTVSQNIKNERVKTLTDIAIQNKLLYIESCIGKTFKGVAEKFRKNDIHVVTENFLHVRINPKSIIIPPGSIEGKEVCVQIDGSDKKDLRQAEGEAFGILL